MMTELLALGTLASVLIVPVLYLVLCGEVAGAARDKGYGLFSAFFSCIVYTPVIYVWVVIAKPVTVEKQAEVQQELYETTMRLNASK